MNFFDKNRNELSKYFYDLSKAVLLGWVGIPIFQGKVTLKFGIAGALAAMLLLMMGMFLKKRIKEC